MHHTSVGWNVVHKMGYSVTGERGSLTHFGVSHVKYKNIQENSVIKENNQEKAYFY